MRSRSQIYAQKVYEQVSRLEKEWGEEEPKRKKYGSMAHRLPVLVRKAGLAQALSFVDSRGSEEQKKLLEHLAQVVGEGNAEALLRKSREAELPEYMRLTHEVLAALLWYKRFSQSVLGVEEGEKGGAE